MGYFSSWTSSSQFITGWIVGPFMLWIPPHPHKLSFFPTNLYDGWRCLLGMRSSTRVFDRVTYSKPHEGFDSLAGDICHTVPWLLPVNTVTNLLLTLMLVIVLKRFGAAFLYIVSTARLPLISEFSSSPSRTLLTADLRRGIYF